MEISSLLFLWLAAISAGCSFCFHTNPVLPKCHRNELSRSLTSTGSASRLTLVLYDSNKKGKEANEDAKDDTVDRNQKQERSRSKLDIEQEHRERRKSQVAKAAAQIIKRNEEEAKSSLLDKLNPFNAGQSLRKSLDSAITSLARASSGPGVLSEDPQRSIYYLDDRFKESGGALFTQESNPYLTQLEKDEYIPEILIVGAKGEIGRLVVKRLLLEGRSRVRVLVPDLYSGTLNMLGTGVVYYQGDLNNIDSLETALTDVDKIVHINSAPRPDEDAFQEKFMGFAEDNLRGSKDLGKIKSSLNAPGATNQGFTVTDLEWERLESVLEVRASLAREIDYVGMQNLIRAYQNVRFADYGTGQAAKRSLFKFQSRPEDFNLFMIDDSDTEDAQPKVTVCDEGNASKNLASSMDEKPKMEAAAPSKQSYSYPSGDDDLFDEFEDVYKDEDDDDYARYAEAYEEYDMYDDTDLVNPASEQRQDTAVKTQVQWIRNQFNHGVFVGRVPQSTSAGIGGEASIISSKLSTRDGNPEDGIDLSGGFGGFMCRICADGGVYEAFIRDASYERYGIEYICEFSTVSKAPQKGNASRNKFVTARLPFESFKPVRRRGDRSDLEDAMPAFKGKDVRYLGFRYRSSRNPNSPPSKRNDRQMNSFYIAFSYIKLFRIQPEPEFVYLSDARIPPVVLDSQLRHDLHQLVPTHAISASGPTNTGAFQILDENALQQISSDKMARSPEETYYKYCGEEVLKGSGLSYAIIRVAGYNEDASSEASTIDLKSTDDDIKPVSRAEVAQVCVSALLDPNALNKSFYISKKDKGSSTIDETISAKFSSLPTDPVKR